MLNLGTHWKKSESESLRRQGHALLEKHPFVSRTLLSLCFLIPSRPHLSFLSQVPLPITLTLSQVYCLRFVFPSYPLYMLCEVRHTGDCRHPVPADVPDFIPSTRFLSEVLSGISITGMLTRNKNSK